jgi:hypothetical protein
MRMTVECNFAAWSTGEPAGDRRICLLKAAVGTTCGNASYSLTPTCDEEKCILIRMMKEFEKLPHNVVLDTSRFQH